MTLQLLDKTPPKEVAEQFYQARKKLGDEARKLPQGAIGPFVNDEFSDVSFALYSVEAPGMPLRKLTRVAEELRQRFGTEVLLDDRGGGRNRTCELLSCREPDYLFPTAPDRIICLTGCLHE